MHLQAVILTTHHYYGCWKTVYSKTEKIHQKTLKDIYESNYTHDNLLLQANTVSVRQRHLRFLVIEYIKACGN